MARPIQFTQEEHLVRGDDRARRRQKELGAKPPTRPDLHAAKVPVMSEEEYRAEVAGLLRYDPFRSNGEFGGRFDYAAGFSCVDFFHRRLTHAEGPRALQPLGLERWQQALLLTAFGWKRADGTRRYREVFLYVPRKNGKSTLAAGLVLYRLMEFDDSGQQVYSVAASRDQASLVFDSARKMVQQDPGLTVGFRIRVTTKRLEYVRTNSFYRALAADAPKLHGLNPSLYVFDELHAQPDREMYDTMKTATGAQSEPLAFYITTADFARESICNEAHDYAAKVRDGTVADPAFLPVLFEASAEDDWTSPATWRKANPNLGVSVTEEFLARECARAKESPEYQNTFKRLYLNLRTSSDVAWLPVETWDRCGAAVDVRALGGRPCYAGLDLASTQDLTALVLVFPEDGNAVLPFFFVPSETAAKRESRGLKPSYVAWKQRGLMEFTPGNVCDYAFVRAKVAELAAVYDLRGIAYDPWGAQQLATDLQGDGHSLVSFRQGYASLSAPAKELEKLVVGGQLRHGGHPVLRWCAGNVMVETDAAGNIKPSKAKSGDKIDGIVALVMALGLAIAAEAAQPVPAIFQL